MKMHYFFTSGLVMGNHYFLKRMFKNTVGKYEQQRSEKEKK